MAAACSLQFDPDLVVDLATSNRYIINRPTSSEVFTAVKGLKVEAGSNRRLVKIV
jgi:hypothetical protein